MNFSFSVKLAITKIWPYSCKNKGILMSKNEDVGNCPLMFVPSFELSAIFLKN